MEPGLFVTFFTEGESFESELPPVGPLEHLVVRERSLIADRKDVHHVDHFGSGSRWIEAELELQRALGNEPGSARRPALRIGAAHGVYLRFASFEAAPGDEPVPELGPYAVVAVHRHRVEADGDVLAIRSATQHDPWELTRVGGSALAGLIRPDIAFRTRATNYHPRIHPARPSLRSDSSPVRRAPPAVEPKRDEILEDERLEPRVAPDALRWAPPPIEDRPAAQLSVTVDNRRPTPEPPASLRSRLGGDLPTQQTQTTREGDIDGRVANRRVALFVIGALVIGLVAFGALRNSQSSGSGNVVGVGKPVRGPHWDYKVETVSLASEVSGVGARGVYLIVWVTATNKDSPAASLTPRDFALVDGSGGQYAPLAVSDRVYRSDSNPGSPLIWMTSFAVGQPVSTPVVFDVAPALRGAQLVIIDVPTIRVQLD